MRKGRMENSGDEKCAERTRNFLESEAFVRQITADDRNDREGNSEASTPRVNSKARKLFCVARPRLSNKSMLKGLVERAENYNKTVDKELLTDSRIAFDVTEDGQLKGSKSLDLMAKDLQQLAVSNQHISTRGRGDIFGKLRSSSECEEAKGELFESPVSNNGSTGSCKKAKVIPFSTRINVILSSDGSGNTSRVVVADDNNLSFQSPRRTALSSRLTRESNEPLAQHHYDPSTAYNGKVEPDYRYSYKPQQPACAHVVPVPVGHRVVPFISSVVSPVRPGQRYPKRPENNLPPPSKPKHLNHNYYDINLYGAAQEEIIAQRIEKTVRQTEAPPRF
ncbi:unnamed protein product [Caenorhabditis sp. 36 PRJEB53466]|nr:unnamed protein product [Caenorhabditis sp. 36 PRJEB53466]